MSNSVDGKKLLQEIKAKDKARKKDGHMKKLNIDWKIVKTVLVMIGLAAVFALGGLSGWNVRGWFNDNVKSEAKVLSAEVASKD